LHHTRATGTSLYYSVGRRLSVGGPKDDHGEDIAMRKWSMIFGQIILVLAYWFQFVHADPPKAFNPNRWLWNLHKLTFPADKLKVTAIGSLAGFAY
jgi:hypothetical protein